MRSRFVVGVCAAALCVCLVDCKKKVAVVRPPEPPPAVAEKPAPPPAPEKPAEAPAPTPEPAKMPDTPTRANIQELLNRIQDIYFDYDKHTLRPEALTQLQDNAKTLTAIIRDYPTFKLTVEGHCDERGSDEYNLALGDSRAKNALDYLVSLGLPASQLRAVSYGKEKPVCTDHNEACWQKNRRAHITQDQGS